MEEPICLTFAPAAVDAEICVLFLLLACFVLSCLTVTEVMGAQHTAKPMCQGRFGKAQNPTGPLGKPVCSGHHCEF